jgi:hypothetical protein
LFHLLKIKNKIWLFEVYMKLTWKIVIAVGMILVAILVTFSGRFLNGSSLEDYSPMMQAPPSNANSKNEESVDDLLKKMEFGSIAFNVPNNINIDSSHQIQLKLSIAETVEALKQSITDEGRKYGATIKVSDRMEARLSGNMFEITAISDKVQAVSKSEQTLWKWEIHPKKGGKHKLHLTLTAHLEVDGYSTPRTIRTFDRLIEIDVSFTQKISLFFNNNWQWLWATILVPVAGWLWKRSKKQQTNTSS